MLISFPIELISSITSLLSGQDIGKLWNCGDKRLHEQLGTRGGVKSFDILGDPLFPSKWPSLVRHLAQLQEFRLNRSELTYRIPVTLVNCLDLPPTLRRLRLYCAGALKHFLDSLIASPRHYDMLERLYIATTDTSSAEEPLHLLKTLPSLTWLRIGRTGSYSGSLSDICPPNAIYLNLSMVNIYGIDFKLPQSLEHLALWIEDFTKIGELGDLPSGLRLLKLDFMKSHKFSLNEIARLPRGLTHLIAPADYSDELSTALPPYLEVPYISRGMKRFTEASLQQLPRSITQLHRAPAITIGNVEFLPPNLKELFGTTIAYGTDVFAKLPSTMETISLTSAPEMPYSPEIQLLAPHNLISLSGIKASLLDSLVLPPTLRTLNLTKGSSMTCERVLKLPRGLKYLSVPVYDSEIINYLPNALTRLHLGPFFGFEPTWNSITSALAANLPQTLKHLDLFHTDFETSDILLLLPKGLTKLNLIIKTLEPAPLSRWNMPELRFLSLSVTDDSAGLIDALLVNAPRKLASLSYSVANQLFKDLSFVSLEKLPRGLTSLQLPEAPEFLYLATKAPSLPPDLDSLAFNQREPSWFMPKEDPSASPN